MKTVDLTPEVIEATSPLIPEGSPVSMLNLLRYREQADYGDRADVAPCSGREAYFERYVPAFNAVAAAEGITGIKVTWVANVLTSLIGPPDERWDDVAIVEYPNFAAFRRVVESPTYHSDATPHRDAALEDSRLIAAVQMQMPS